MLTSHTKSRYVLPLHTRTCARLPKRTSDARLRLVTKNLKPIIAARTRAARRARGMTQAELADAVSRTVEAISNIERGLSLPPLDLLQRIAETLEVSLVDLLEEPAASGTINERAALEIQIRKAAAALTIEGLRAASKQLDALADIVALQAR